MTDKTTFTFRLTRAEMAFLRQLAAEERLSVGNYILWKLVDDVQKEAAAHHAAAKTGATQTRLAQAFGKPVPEQGASKAIPYAKLPSRWIDKITGVPVPNGWITEDGVPLKPRDMTEEDYEQRYGIKWR